MDTSHLLDSPKNISDGEQRARQAYGQNSLFLKQMVLAKDIRAFSSMCIIPVGILLNILTIITFVKIKLHKSPSGLQFLCLALSESLLLLGFGMVLPWPYNVKYFHASFCMIHHFLSSSQQLNSSLLLVLMTVQRFVVVAFPLRAKTWNLKKISKVSVVCLAVISGVLGGLSASRRTVDMTRDPYGCKNNPNLQDLTTFSTRFTYTILGVGLWPFCVLIFTVLIAHQLYKQKQARMSMIQQGQPDENKKEFTITLMLFLVANLFLIVKFVQVTIWYVRNYADRSTLHYKHAAIAYNYTRILVTIYHSINTIVYIIFFPEFRKAFLSLIFCTRKICMKGVSRENNLSNGHGNREETSMTDLGQAGTSENLAEDHRYWRKGVQNIFKTKINQTCTQWCKEKISSCDVWKRIICSAEKRRDRMDGVVTDLMSWGPMTQSEYCKIKTIEHWLLSDKSAHAKSAKRGRQPREPCWCRLAQAKTQHDKIQWQLSFFFLSSFLLLSGASATIQWIKYSNASIVFHGKIFLTPKSLFCLISFQENMPNSETLGWCPKCLFEQQGNNHKQWLFCSLHLATCWCLF